MQQMYTDDYLKVRDEYAQARKVMFWSLVGGVVGMIITGVIKNLLWNHWLMNVVAFSCFIPTFINLYSYLMLEKKLDKLTPKKEYLEFQLDEKIYKRVCNYFFFIALISIFSIIALVVIDQLYYYELIGFQVENYLLIILFSVLSAFGNTFAMNYTIELRKQYLRAKEKELK